MRSIQNKSIFKFKQFDIKHDTCNLKITTDSVLLGSWADIKNCNKILDVGTGCGIIAIMLAQRSNAIIDAIDIVKENYLLAHDNFIASQWNSRLHAFHVALQNYKPSHKYNHIVCNPPFYQNALRPKNHSTSIAKHNLSLTIDELLIYSIPLLNDKGKISVIIPYQEKEKLTLCALKLGLYISRMLLVKTHANRTAKRVLIELSTTFAQLDIHEISIYSIDKSFTDVYIHLTKDYYINF